MADEPIALWMSWQHSPQSTMVVHWLTPKNQPHDELYFRQKSASEDNSWIKAEGEHFKVPQGNPYLIHALELIELKSDTLYEVKLEEKVYSFKTAPDNLDNPVVFLDGGDIYHDDMEVVERMNALVVKQDPLFVILGGDLAYTCKRSMQSREFFERWLAWLTSWTKTMVTPEGRMIPMIPVIGNHEVLGKGLNKPNRAQLFYHLFAIPESEGYRSLTFGNYLHLLLLDSNHTHAVKGDQAHFVEAELSKHKDFKYKFASYHVPAYPGHRNFNTPTCQDIRKYWCPHFEMYNLTSAFEHHDHLYKRTHLMKNGAVNPEGVLYLGDGAWGVDKPRAAKKSWYIAESAAIRHVFVVTLTKDKATFDVLAENGTIYESFSR